MSRIYYFCWIKIVPEVLDEMFLSVSIQLKLLVSDLSILRAGKRISGSLHIFLGPLSSLISKDSRNLQTLNHHFYL